MTRVSTHGTIIEMTNELITELIMACKRASREQTSLFAGVYNQCRAQWGRPLESAVYAMRACDRQRRPCSDQVATRLRIMAECTRQGASSADAVAYAVAVRL